MKKKIKTVENKDINNKHPKTIYPKKQFCFVIISIILLISLCLFVAGRSIYYYSALREQKKVESNIIATNIKNKNELVESGDGLYKEGEEYVFKGKEVNNYLMYANQLFRIMRVMDDNSIKLVAEDNVNTLIFGEEKEYKDSNLYQWLNKTDKKDTGVYLNSLNDKEKYLNETSWCMEVLTSTKISCDKEKKNDFVSMLSLSDYNDALSKDSYLNINKYTYLLGKDEQNNILYLDTAGNIKDANPLKGYGVRPVITLKSQIDIIKGEGTKDNPFIFEEDSGYTNKFVKLGNDNYRIFKETETHLYLSLDNYLMVKGKPYALAFSNSTSLYDINNRRNIGYYLNNSYLKSLSYKDDLDTCTFAIGEMSDALGYKYDLTFSQTMDAKVGLLNMMDLKLNNSLENYFLINRTSEMGELAYLHQTNGKLVEEVVTAKKNIVPVVCLLKTKITNGSGTLEIPYIVE